MPWWDFFVPEISSDDGDAVDGSKKTRKYRVGNASPKAGLPRIPATTEGIQVNFCKNPRCTNFGRPAALTSKRGRGAGVRDAYIVSEDGRSPRGGARARLTCKLCGSKSSVKSNLAISQEVHRLLAYLDPEPEPACPNDKCLARGRGIFSSPSSYQRFGRTRHGSLRFRCKACRKTFSVGGPTLRQRKPHENREIFMELVNRAPLRRILEKRDITAQTLYGKIDFLERQALRFLASRESRLLGGLPLKHLHISVDRQVYLTNWRRHTKRENVSLHSAVSADNSSGYVFGCHLNFDDAFVPAVVEADVRTDDDDLRPQQWRRNARFWLKRDYEESKEETGLRTLRVGRKTVLDDAIATYQNIADRADEEVSDNFNEDLRLPEFGMQVHAEYTLYGHFIALRRLFSGAQRITFYLDQDPGMAAACLSAFHEEVRNDFVQAFYVRINKKMTKPKKLEAYQNAVRRFEAAQFANPQLKPWQVKLAMIRVEYSAMARLGTGGDRWLVHPLPTMNEPEKALCHLTWREDSHLSEDQLCQLYLDGSMYGADRFLELIRRRLSPLERAIATPSNMGRTWSGYAPYNPALVSKLLTLLRVYWNYCYVSKESRDKLTPAMRLGLAKGRVRVEDIIRFDPTAAPADE
jgi:transposase-like protein